MGKSPIMLPWESWDSHKIDEMREQNWCGNNNGSMRESRMVNENLCSANSLWIMYAHDMHWAKVRKPRESLNKWSVKCTCNYQCSKPCQLPLRYHNPFLIDSFSSPIFVPPLLWLLPLTYSMNIISVSLYSSFLRFSVLILLFSSPLFFNISFLNFLCVFLYHFYRFSLVLDFEFVSPSSAFFHYVNLSKFYRFTRFSILFLKDSVFCPSLSTTSLPLT